MQPLWALTQWWIATGIPHTERNCFPSGHFTARREGPFYTPAKLDLTQSFPYGPAAMIIDSISCRGVFGFLFACHQFATTLCEIQVLPFWLQYFNLHTVFFIWFLFSACKNNLYAWPVKTVSNVFASPHPMCKQWLLHACCSARWSMNAQGTGSASPRHSWKRWPSSGSGTRRSFWPKPWSPCRRRDMPTRRSWSSTETASTSRTSARISGRRLVSGIPSQRELSHFRNISHWMRWPFLC